MGLLPVEGPEGQIAGRWFLTDEFKVQVNAGVRLQLIVQKINGEVVGYRLSAVLPDITRS